MVVPQPPSAIIANIPSTLKEQDSTLGEDLLANQTLFQTEGKKKGKKRKLLKIPSPTSIPSLQNTKDDGTEKKETTQDGVSNVLFD